MALFKSDNVGKTDTAKFPAPGAVVEGTIVRISDPIEKRKFGAPDEVDTWKSGKPKMQVCITLDTGNRNPDDPEDDGTVGLWVLDDYSRPGNSLFPHSMLDAINQAVQASGAEDLEIGGKLAVRYADNDPDSKNPQNPRKRYQARYTPAPRGGGMFSKADEQPAAAPAAAPAPADNWQVPEQAAAPQSAPEPEQAPLPDTATQAGALAPDTVRTIDVMIANGIGTDVIVNATGVTAEQVDARR